MKLPNKNILIASAVILMLAASAATYVIFFAPLINGLKIKYTECKKLEDEIVYVRNIIESVKAKTMKHAILSEDKVSIAMDELTTLGKKNNIKFISVAPQQIKKSEECKVLPVDMEFISTLRDLTLFLGALDEMDTCLIEVNKFTITRDAQDPEKERTRITIDMYLLGQA